jgi:two-component system, LytTR family, response regulator
MYQFLRRLIQKFTLTKTKPMDLPLKTILIEDEPNSLNLLQYLLQKHCGQDVDIRGAFTDPLLGLQAIQREQPDLVILDIEMPKLNGFELLERCQPLAFKVVFTTAYNQYAVRAFKFSAIDYLLKPLIPDDLVEAVKKVQQSPAGLLPQQVQVLQQFNPVKAGIPNRMVISTMEGLIFVNVLDIVHCDSDGPYTHIYLADGDKALMSKTLRDVEEMLHYESFFRIHHSHLINLQHVKKFIRSEDEVLMVNGTRIPVARSRKSEFLEMVTG